MATLTIANLATKQAQEFDWLIPSPMWAGSSAYHQVDFFRPALFEFRSDNFMEEFLNAAAAPDPKGLLDARLLPPDPAALAGIGLPPANRLFQPIHGCFYLAAASLVCREPGFPDRRVDRPNQEKTSFVFRKLVNGSEYAWVIQPEGKSWQPVNGNRRTLLDGEERLPVYPIPLADGRQLFCAYLPTSSSDTYNIQPEELAVDGEALNQPIEELGSRFVTPLQAPSLLDTLPDDPAWTTSVYLLVELWEFLQSYLPDVSAAIQSLPAALAFTGDRSAEKGILMDFLEHQVYKGSLTLASALQAVAQNQNALNAPGGGDLAALGFSKAAYSLRNRTTLNDLQLSILLDRVKAALPAKSQPLALPKLDISVSVQYVVRFVYERPLCDPPVAEVSMPSQPFTFAPFFDPDAPARPVRIPLPTDVSIAGLRKFKKNVTFVMSDAMRKKMSSIVGKEQDVLKGAASLQEDSNAFAFICSFSIQIIFIIAFMLLLIFVIVFNIIFWWIAFFKICLPVPKKLIPS